MTQPPPERGAAAKAWLARQQPQPPADDPGEVTLDDALDRTQAVRFLARNGNRSAKAALDSLQRGYDTVAREAFNARTADEHDTDPPPAA